MTCLVYPTELEIADTTESATSASYLDLLLSIGVMVSFTLPNAQKIVFCSNDIHPRKYLFEGRIHYNFNIRLNLQYGLYTHFGNLPS